MSDTSTKLAAFEPISSIGNGNGSNDMSIDELHQTNPKAEEQSNSTKAIAASLRDLENGETGRPAIEVLNEFKVRYNTRRRGD